MYAFFCHRKHETNEWDRLKKPLANKSISFEYFFSHTESVLRWLTVTYCVATLWWTWYTRIALTPCVPSALSWRFVFVTHRRIRFNHSCSCLCVRVESTTLNQRSQANVWNVRHVEFYDRCPSVFFCVCVSFHSMCALRVEHNIPHVQLDVRPIVKIEHILYSGPSRRVVLAMMMYVNAWVIFCYVCERSDKRQIAGTCIFHAT